MNKQQSIAIIGSGCSGLLVATQLLLQATSPLVIHLIERSRPQLGRGLAYSTQETCHLLNIPASNMSAFPDQPNHFLDWVQSQEHLAGEILPSGVQAGTFVPRQIYGTYLQAVLDEAEANAPADVRLERHYDEAIAITQQTDGATVHLHNQFLQVKKVVLAFGNFPPSNPPVQTGDFYNSGRYTSAWSANALSELHLNEPILLIGSSLTMVDVAIALQKRGHQGSIHVVSRHGLLPQHHKAKADDCTPQEAQIIPQSLRTLVRQIREQVGVAAAHTQDWRSVIDSMRPMTQSLWQALSLREKQQFLRHVQPYWDIHRHRIAPDVAHRIDELQQKGQMLVKAGRIQAYQEDSSGVDVIVRPRYTKESKTLRVSRVVNCTGPASNYRKLQHPLVVNLRSQGLLCPDALAIGIETAPNGALLNAQGIASNQLYTLGPTRKGGLWETVAVPEIRGQALALAQELLSKPQVEFSPMWTAAYA